MNPVDPLLIEAIKKAVAEANAGAVPYPWVATVVGFLVLCLGTVGKMYLNAVKDRMDTMSAYLAFAKETAPVLDRATEALKEHGRGTP